MSRRFAPVAILAAMVPLLAACEARMIEHDPHLAHPLGAEVKTAVATFDRGEVDTLSRFDAERLARLAGESVKRGAGPISVEAVAADRPFAQVLLDGLRRGGAAEIHLREAGTAGAVVVRVPVWVAVLPECGAYDRGITPDWTNAPHSDWGCSVQRNIGLMVQNPADLVRARDASGRDGNRSAEVVGKYGRGEATGSAVESTSAGTTSKVGNAAK